MKLRNYQQESVDKFFSDAKKHPRDAQLLALPTGAGKSLIIAEICRRAANGGMRVLVLHRTKELVSQNHDRYVEVDPSGEERAGIYSAGIGLKHTDKMVTFAGVQSACSDATVFGKIRLVIVDEAHQIPRAESSQYQKVLADLRSLGEVKLLGLTASPYRLDGGVIFGGKDTQFDRVSHSVPLSDLFDNGYLTKPVTVDVDKVDLSGVRTTAGDYNQADMQTKFLGRSLTPEIVATADHHKMKSVLVFASGVAHAELIKEELRAAGQEVRCVTGETLPILRETFLSQFDSGTVRFLVNVDVLTTGFDCPRVDGIVLARGTQSPGLFYQMVGRGFRLFPNKPACYVLDYGGNIDLHGPVDSETFGIDTIKPPSSGDGEAPKRICPRCFEVQHASLAKCVNCGLEFPRKEKSFLATKKSITIQTTDHDVEFVDYKRWNGKEGKTDTMLVQYKLKDNGASLDARKRWAREWVCIEHSGYARGKAESWWRDRSDYVCPETIEEALEIARVGGIQMPLSITIKPDGKFDRIVAYALNGPKPEVKDIDFDEVYEMGYDPDEAPF